MKVKKFVVNQLGENSLVLSDDSGECVIVDPGFYFREEHDEIKQYISENNLNPVKVINTHCHFDHIMGVEFIRDTYGIPFYAHNKDEFWITRAVDQGRLYGFDIKPVKPIDEYLEENKPVTFGQTKLEVLHIPGHTPGHVVFYNPEDKILIAGDVLFYGSIGRTDLPGGDHETLISNIKNKLLVLPEETTVYCGHGPETTIGFEKSSNPFLT